MSGQQHPMDHKQHQCSTSNAGCEQSKQQERKQKAEGKRQNVHGNKIRKKRKQTSSRILEMINDERIWVNNHSNE